MRGHSSTNELCIRWRYNAGDSAIIWQLMFTDSGNLVGQKRFVLSRRALFFSIDKITGKVDRDDYLLMDHTHQVPAGEGWFVGLETTHSNLVYCYTHQLESPEHKGIWAVDFKSDKVVWSRSDIIFSDNINNEFLVYRLSAFGGFPERHYLLIDPLTGEDIRHLGLESPTIHAMRQKAESEEKRQKVILPVFVSEVINEQGEALQRAGIDRHIHSECIVQGHFTIAVLHEQADCKGSWHSHLKVWRSDILIYTTCLDEGVEKPSLNNFLIQSENLYYLKNNQELVCVTLT